jgi:hypothetical protein
MCRVESQEAAAADVDPDEGVLDGLPVDDPESALPPEEPEPPDDELSAVEDVAELSEDELSGDDPAGAVVDARDPLASLA